MSFFALLTLVPSTVAVGAALSFLERFVGPQRIARGQDEAVAALRVLMSPRLTDEVIAPFVRAQLSQQRGGVALGGLVLTWWLSSHLFTSTSHALDRAYGVTDRRPTLTRRFIALGFALASVVVVALTLGILVVGPLGGGPDIAERLGLGRAIALTWSLARWPALLLVLIGFLVCLHRFSPNVEHSWKDCVPGAALGVVLWVVAAAGFRLYLGLGGGVARGVALQDETVAVIGRAVGAVVATVLWTYFSSVAILIGGELNAELARVRRRMRNRKKAGSSTGGGCGCRRGSRRRRRRVRRMRESSSPGSASAGRAPRAPARTARCSPSPAAGRRGRRSGTAPRPVARPAVRGSSVRAESVPPWGRAAAVQARAAAPGLGPP
jgi:membrane protein